MTKKKKMLLFMLSIYLGINQSLNHNYWCIIGWDNWIFAFLSCTFMYVIAGNKRCFVIICDHPLGSSFYLLSFAVV